MNIIEPMLGGAIIGTAVTIMLYFNGRITGISGIVNGILTSAKNETAWRVAFVFGLIFSGFFLSLYSPSTFDNSYEIPIIRLVLGGLLVGYGASLGSGCTSGHGICGISRLSPRSIVATLSFLTSGFLIVYVMEHVL